MRRLHDYLLLGALLLSLISLPIFYISLPKDSIIPYKQTIPDAQRIRIEGSRNVFSKVRGLVAPKYRVEQIVDGEDVVFEYGYGNGCFLSFPRIEFVFQDYHCNGDLADPDVFGVYVPTQYESVYPEFGRDSDNLTLNKMFANIKSGQWTKMSDENPVYWDYLGRMGLLERRSIHFK